MINGTGGEAPTTSDAEKADLVAAVVDAVGDRAHVVAGVGTFDTAHTIHLAEQAAKAGAHGLLVVTPYYSRPPQAGLLAHFRAVADATDLPVLLYDIPERVRRADRHRDPARAGRRTSGSSAVKDAKGDLTASSRVIAETELAFYSGDDAMTLPLLSIGGVGVVGTSTHFSGVGTKALIEAYQARRHAHRAGPAPAAAADLHRHLPHPGLDPGQGRAAAARHRRRPGAAAAGRRHPGADRAAAGRSRRRRSFG